METAMNNPLCPWMQNGLCNPMCQFYDQSNSSCIVVLFMKSNIKKEPSKRKAPSKFIPPTVDEVRAYMLEKNMSGFTPESFVGYYESKGWKVGSSSMKNWKAACDNWNRRRLDKNGFSLDFGEYGNDL